MQKHQLIARRFLGGKIAPWGFKAKDGSLTAINIDSAVFTFSAPEAQIQAACLGLGIAQVGVYHALKYLKSGQLKALLLEHHDSGNYEMVIQYPHRALIAPRVKVIVDYLLATFNQAENLHFPLEALFDYRA